MLSSRAPSPTDGGPLQRPSSVQGLYVDCRPRSVAPVPVHATVTSPLEAHLAEASPTYTSHTSSARRRETQYTADLGSPRYHSPLRHSVSYTDTTDLEFDTPRQRPESLNMTYTGDRNAGAPDARSQGRRGWFGRASIGDAEGPPTPPKDHPPVGSRSSSTTPKAPSPASASSSRFAFFANSVSALKELTSTPVSVPQDDELMNMDIEAALSPAGSPQDGTAFSPAAYKNLQMTATGMLKKFQIAYQQRTVEYRELQAERDAQDEEHDEAEIRVRHLKMQLEDMARKAAEREAAMQSLLQELASERSLRIEERNAHAESKQRAMSDVSTLSEDLGVEDDQKKREWRKSTATLKSDLTLDTDEESVDGASIFSRSRSPTFTVNAPEMNPTPIESSAQPTKKSQQIAGIQKLWKGYTPSQPKELDPSPAACRHCQAKDASMAWDTVDLLKAENRGLKDRIQELESAVETALDVVNGLKL